MTPEIVHSRPTITEADVAAVVAVLRSGHLEDGDAVRTFERDVASRLGRRYALATTNGFAAIHLALIGLGVGGGDEVLIPSYSCPALLNPVLVQRGVPVILDTAPRSVTMCPQAVRAHAGPKTKAIIAAHIFGIPAPIEEIRAAAPGVPIIEDCAQGLGGLAGGRPMGSLSEVAILSFYATKLVCAGDAGMVLTDDEAVYVRMTDHQYYGHKAGHTALAMNYHLTNLPAALGRSQFAQLDAFVAARCRLAAVYDRAFAAHPAIGTDFDARASSVFYRYPVTVQNRAEVMHALRAQGIGAGFGVLDGLHRLVGAPAEAFPHTERHLREVLSLPIYPSLTDAEADRVAGALIEAVASV